MANPEQARSLLRELYSAVADIETDNVNSAFIKIYNTNHWVEDKIPQNLCDNLNDTQTLFPATNMTLKLKLMTT